MKVPDNFEDYLKKGIVKRQRQDISRARFLIQSSDISKLDLDNRIKNEGPTDINANSLIKETYDLIMELIRAKMLVSGYSSSGEGAHEAEVSFLRMLGFSENDLRFLNQIRFIRNGISYYGKIFKKEDAEDIINFLKEFYPRLRSKLSKI